MMKNRLWEEIPNLSFDNRTNHTSTLFQDYIITHAGCPQNAIDIFNDIKILNLKTGSFEEFILQGDQPSKRESHSACLFATNKILLFGGFGGKVLHDVAIISIEKTARN